MRLRRPTTFFVLACMFAIALVACGKKKTADPAPAKSAVAAAKSVPVVELGRAATNTDENEPKGTPAVLPPAAAKHQQFLGVPRPAFNQLAAELFLPLFWREDTDKDGALDGVELAVLWGFGEPAKRDASYWIGGGILTQNFADAHKQIVALHKQGDVANAIVGPEGKRRAAVLKELRQGRPTLIRTTFENAQPQDRKLVRLIMAAAVMIEQIYAKQSGIDGMAETLPPEDTPGRMLLYRNQGPWCLAPKTERDPDCNAMNNKPKRISGLYPKETQSDKGFCEKLAQRKDARELMHHFHVVRGQGDKLTAKPYHEEWAGEMNTVADMLTEAANLYTDDKTETSFRAYLLGAAKAFRDGSWTDADEAWSKMNARNSRWYLRIGPDETYFEPCSRKSGFHVSFARVNQDSLRWQDKLDPIKNDMETALAALAGPPYVGRKVAFHLPDFIDIVVNAGDSRSPHGATIGQSLPNWGPVANEGRGRTVAMTNLYTDPDSTASFKEQAASLLCKESLAIITWDQEPAIMSTVLHEAAHNLGPAHEYKVNGKTDDELFGGPLASTMEELKAQTAALWLNGWLAAKGTIDQKLSHSAWGRDVLWSFGHISRGMYNMSGKPKPYSHLASIQIGHLLQEKAVTWNADKLAANGKDKGCMTIDYAKFGKVTEQLMRTVAQIKAKGDKDGALQLRSAHVDRDGAWKTLRETIRERWLRSPKATFVHAIDL